MEKKWIEQGFSRHLECKTFIGWINFKLKWEGALGQMKILFPNRREGKTFGP
jgi:hypothetical protein